MSPAEFLLHHNRTGGTELIGQVILITEGYEIGRNASLNLIDPTFKNIGPFIFPSFRRHGGDFSSK
jgi:hypothetical protein